MGNSTSKAGLILYHENLNGIIRDRETFTRIMFPLARWYCGHAYDPPSNFAELALFETMQGRQEANEVRYTRTVARGKKAAAARWGKNIDDECISMHKHADAFLCNATKLNQTKLNQTELKGAEHIARDDDSNHAPPFTKEELIEIARGFTPALEEDFVEYFYSAMEADDWCDKRGERIANIKRAMRVWREHWKPECGTNRGNQPLGVIFHDEKYDLSKFGE